MFGLLPALSTTVRIVALGFSAITKNNLNIISGQVTTGVNIIVNTDALVSLKGTITDSNNLPITNGIVMVESIKNLGIAEPDSNGKYSIKGLIPDNDYKVFAVAAGFYKPYTQSDVIITKDVTTEINININPIESEGITLKSSATSSTFSSCIIVCGCGLQTCLCFKVENKKITFEGGFIIGGQRDCILLCYFPCSKFPPPCLPEVIY